MIDRKKYIENRINKSKWVFLYPNIIDRYVAISKEYSKKIEPKNEDLISSAVLQHIETIKPELRGEQGAIGEKGEIGEKGLDGKDGANGYTPVKGIDYFTEEEKLELIGLIKSQIKPTVISETKIVEKVDQELLNKAILEIINNTPIEISGEVIRDELQLLKGDQRLDASAIKNLPTQKVVNVGGGGRPNMNEIKDVVITSPQNGDVIEYNATLKKWNNKPKQYFNARDFGVKGDGNVAINIGITNGSPTLTCSTGTFTTSDIGKTIVIFDPTDNTNKRRSVFTIIAVASATSITLSANATYTITPTSGVNTIAIYGTDDTAAIQTALNTLSTLVKIITPNNPNIMQALSQYVLEFSEGDYIITDTITTGTGVGIDCKGKIWNAISNASTDAIRLGIHTFSGKIYLMSTWGGGIQVGTPSANTQTYSYIENIEVWNCSTTALYLNGYYHTIDRIFIKKATNGIVHDMGSDTIISYCYIVGTLNPIKFVRSNQIRYPALLLDTCGGSGTNGGIYFDNTSYGNNNIDINLQAFTVVNTSNVLSPVVNFPALSSAINSAIRIRGTCNNTGGSLLSINYCQETDIEIEGSNKTTNVVATNPITTGVDFGTGNTGFNRIKLNLSAGITPYTGTAYLGFTYFQSGSEYQTITSASYSGNIGAGLTTTPSARVHAERSTDASVILAKNTTAAGNNVPNYISNSKTSTSRAYSAQVDTDTTARLMIETSGKIEWGAGGTSARDTNLYRSSANVLKTDDAFEFVGGTTSGNLAFSNEAGATNVNYITMDNTPTSPPVTAGSMYWDTTGTLNIVMGNGQVIQQVGEEFFRYGKASSAISDTNLQLVYKTGVVGASGFVTFAPAVAGITHADQILGIATETLATNDFGRVTVHGVVRGTNTTGSNYGEVWTDNTDIYYNPATGGLTKNKPTGLGLKLQVGTVINAAAAGSGSFFVNFGSSSELGGTDTNVSFGTLADNDIIQYDSATQLWKNETLASAGIQATSQKSVANGYASLDGSGRVPTGELPTTIQYTTEKGAVNGYASLDSAGKVPITQLPSSSPSAKAIIEGGVTGGYFWWTECTDNGNMTASSTGANTRTVKAGEANHQGIFNIQSTGISTNNGYRWNTGTTGADQFLIQGGEKAICIFRTPADLTKTNLAVGFMDNNFGTQVDAAMIYFNGTSSVYGMTSSNSVVTTSSAITTLSNSTWYRFEVEVNSNATAVDFTVYDGTGAVLGTQQITTNIPTGSGRTLFGNMYILSATASIADLGDVDYIAIATGPMVR